VCETCGRRFGVASNLNRHVRRCILRPVNTANAPRPTSSDDGSTPQITTPTPVAAVSASLSPAAISAPCQFADPHLSTNGEADSVPAAKRKSKRAQAPSPSQSHASVNSAEHQPEPQSDSPPRVIQQTFKRRRRAPSPSRWIPFSLLAFDLSPIELQKSTPVPLPPVTPVPASVRTVWSEERDSWDENVGVAPYDRYEYKGTLPGPGLGMNYNTGTFGGRDVGNLGGAGSFIMGRLVLA